MTDDPAASRAMTDDEKLRLCALLDETGRLLYQTEQIRARIRAARYYGLFDPGWPRMLYELWRVRSMLNRAEQLLHQVNRLMGNTARVRWLGMGRTGWLCAQWSNGVFNAFWALYSFAQERYVVGLLSALCVLVTATWRLPPAD
jgi:hypothetical protein